jgi:flagellar biosynthetic protein FlhB
MSRPSASATRMYGEIISQQIQGATPEADVIVTNPTHFSVAIKYDGESDERADRRREGRRPARVPDPPDRREARRPDRRAAAPGAGPLLRDRGRVRRSAPEHYEAIAELLAYVYRIDADAARRGGAAEDNAPVEQEPVAS